MGDSTVVMFPVRAEVKDPLDDVVMCQITINGHGDIELVVNAECVETIEQHNWLIAKIVDASSRLIDRKNEISDTL